MASWTKRAVVLGLACGLGGMVASACADNSLTIFIRQVQAPTQGQCSYTADPSAMAFGLGTLDLMVTSQYRASLLVGNQMVQRGAPDMARAESSRVQLNEAEIVVKYTDGMPVNSFTVPGNGFVDPSTGSSPGWGVFMTILIDSKTGDILRAALGADGTKRLSKVGRVVAVVKVFGKTLGGADVETGEFEFPIEVCFGCLVSFGADRNDPTFPSPNCKKCDTAATEVPCLAGQDEALDCCECYARLGESGPTLCEP